MHCGSITYKTVWDLVEFSFAPVGSLALLRLPIFIRLFASVKFGAGALNNPTTTSPALPSSLRSQDFPVNKSLIVSLYISKKDIWSLNLTFLKNNT